MKDVVLYGDAYSKLPEIPPGSIQAVICTPPPWGDPFDHPDNPGREPTVEGYYTALALIFERVKTLLKPKGTVWFHSANPSWVSWRTIFNLQAFGWYLLRDVVWSRTPKRHDTIFVLSLDPKFKVSVPKTVLSSKPLKQEMSSEIASFCVQRGSQEGDTVLDPFAGSGTTLVSAAMLQRHYIGVELNPTHKPEIERRLEAAEESRYERDLFDAFMS